ncbi:MAG: carboxypeptidase-like regulatory domain-containing protein [Planctomycetota bacterium]|nr:carboxypeptidase-like regulatory domain-containing protein [Planctomycetota bacterium]
MLTRTKLAPLTGLALLAILLFQLNRPGDAAEGAQTQAPIGPHFHGRILAGDTHSPLQGVRLAARPVDFNAGIAQDQALTTTDTEGRFSLPVPSGSEDPVLLAKLPGYSWIAFEKDAEHQDPATPLELSMAPSAKLEVHVVDHGVAEGDLISVTTRAINLRQPAVEGRPGPSMAGPGWGFDATWQVELDAEGRGLLEVPADTVIMSKLRTSGEWRTRKDALELPPGSTYQLDWSIRPGVRVTGLLHDQAGEPIPGAEVQLGQRLELGPVHVAPVYLDPISSHFEKQSVTDEQGRFVFEDVAPGRTLIGTAPAPRSGPFDPMTEHARIARRIEIPADVTEFDVDFETYRGLYATVRLVAPEPAAPWMCKLRTRSTSSHTSISTAVSADGRFVVGPMMPGTHQARISGYLGDLGYPEPITLEPGDRDIEVLLQVAGGLRGVARSSTTGQPVVAMVWYAQEGKRATSGVQSGRDGSFEATGLAPGSYWMTFTDDAGQIATLQGVEVESSEVHDVGDVTLVPSSKVTITFTGPSAKGTYSLLAGTARIEQLPIQTERADELQVPPGVITLLVERLGKPALPHEFTVLAGEDSALTIDLP